MKAIIPAMLISLMLYSCGDSENKSSSETSTTEQSLFVQMANSEMIRNPDPRLLDFRDKPKWEYTNGLVCSAFLQVWEATGDSAFYNYAKSYADSMINADGNILTYKKTDYNIDRVNPGKFLMTLYEKTGDEKYKMAIDTLRDQMRTHPRNADGGFWHKQIYPHQMWLDGLYMGSPFLAQYAADFNEPELFADVANQIEVMDKHAWDQEKGLYFHGWDESRQQKWSDPQTGRSPHAWGRAMGWYAMALVDVLDFFPLDHPSRPGILAIHHKMADAIIAHQDTSGLWWQVLDQPGREGNYLEASASSMFTYFLLKSAKKGYLDGKYLEAGQKGFKSIADQLIKKNEDGTISLTKVCGVAGLGGDPYRDGTFDYYVNEVIRDNDPKGVGPFIMAAILYEQINN